MQRGQMSAGTLDKCVKDAECEQGRLRNVQGDIFKWNVKSEKIKAHERKQIRCKCLTLVGYDLRRW